MEIRYNSEFSLERNREEFLYKFNEFKLKNNFEKSLGIIGSSNINNWEQASELLANSMKDTTEKIGIYAVVSGGTKGGTPELALKISRRINLPTIGVFPEDGEKYALKNFLDMCIVVPRPLYGDVIWGSETPVLAGIPDTVVVNEGEWGTLVEIGTIMKRNKSLIQQKRNTVPVILMNGTRGLSELFKGERLPLPYYESIYSVDNSYELTEILIRNLNSNDKKNN